MLGRLDGFRHQDEGGFTLAELLVVIVIISILVLLAIPVMLHQRDKGYNAAVVSDLRGAATAEESYFAGHDSYSSQTPVGGDLQAEGFKYSPGANYQGGAPTITTHIDPNGTSYCLTSTSASGKTYVWESSKEGLLPANTPCSF